jgi:hypothetical protein
MTALSRDRENGFCKDKELASVSDSEAVFYLKHEELKT